MPYAVDPKSLAAWFNASRDRKAVQIGRKVTLGDIQQKTGLQTSALSDYGLGKRGIDPPALVHLAEYFGEDPVDVFRHFGLLPPAKGEVKASPKRDARFEALAEVWPSLHPRAQEIVLTQALALRGLRPTDPNPESGAGR